MNIQDEGNFNSASKPFYDETTMPNKHLPDSNCYSATTLYQPYTSNPQSSYPCFTSSYSQNPFNLYNYNGFNSNPEPTKKQENEGTENEENFSDEFIMKLGEMLANNDQTDIEVRL